MSNKFQEIINQKNENLESLLIYLDEINKLKPNIDIVTFFEEIFIELYNIIKDEEDDISIMIKENIFNKYNININECGTCNKIKEELDNINNIINPKEILESKEYYNNEEKEVLEHNYILKDIIEDLEKSYDDINYYEFKNNTEDQFEEDDF